MNSEFDRRFASRQEELETLFLSLYPEQRQALDELLKTLGSRYRSRSTTLKQRDREREQDPGWYKGNDLLGMCLYVDQFAGTLNGVRGKLDYLKETGVNYPQRRRLRGRELPQGQARARHHGRSGGADRRLS